MYIAPSYSARVCKKCPQKCLLGDKSAFLSRPEKKLLAPPVRPQVAERAISERAAAEAAAAASREADERAEARRRPDRLPPERYAEATLKGHRRYQKIDKGTVKVPGRDIKVF